MSEEELEQDELDGADEDDGEELAAADDGEADSGDGDEAPAPGKKAKAAVVEEELPSVEAKQKSVTPSPRRWRSSFPAVEGAGDRTQRGGRSAEEAGQQVRQPPI